MSENVSPRTSLLVFILVTIILSIAFGITGYLLGTRKMPNTINSVNVPLPFNIPSPEVKSAKILYLLSGSLDGIFPVTSRGTDKRYYLYMLNPKGERMKKTFSISENFRNIVISDISDTYEQIINVEKLKRGDKIYINYTVDLLDPTKNQVTKIVKLKL